LNVPGEEKQPLLNDIKESIAQEREKTGLVKYGNRKDKKKNRKEAVEGLETSLDFFNYRVDEF
jgi:hypothetical protein